MLGQPIPMLIPEVIGFQLTGALPEGATATDLVLTVTQMLRKKGVVGKFVEYFGDGPGRPDHRGPGDHRQHGAGIRRHLRLLPGHPGDPRLSDRAPAAPPSASRWSRPTPRRRACGASPASPSRCSPTRSSSTSPPSRRRWPARSGRRTGCRWPTPPAASRGALAGEFGKDEDSAGARVAVEGEEPRRRQRRRGDRRHHLLHQHLQPQRADRRRPAGQERGRQGPEDQALGEDLAGARLAGGHRLSGQGRPAPSRSTRSASTWSAMAAPPASATPARCPSRSPRRSQAGDLVAVCGALRQPQLRGPGQSGRARQLPGLAAAGGRLRPGRLDDDRPRPPSRSARARTASRSS